MKRKFFLEFRYLSGSKEYKPLGHKGVTLKDLRHEEETTGARVNIRLLKVNKEGQPLAV